MIDSIIFNRRQVARLGLLAVLLLLPWQTRWIFAQRTIDGQFFEYGQLGIYAVEGLVLLTVLILGRSRRGREYFKNAGASLVFLSTGFVATALALDGLTATAQLLHWAAAVVFFLLLLDERVRREEIIWASALGLVVPGLLGWWQTLTDASQASTILGLGAHAAATLGQAVVELPGGERLLRAYGSFPHPNIFGGYLAAGLLMLAALRPTNRQQRLAAIALTVCLAATLVITFSRSAWLGLAIGLLIGYWPAIREKRLADDWSKRFLLSGLAAIILTAVFFLPALTTRLQGQTRLEEISVAERVGDYQGWFQVWRLNPWTGVGPGGYPLALSSVASGEPAYAYQPIHNSLLLVLGEVGLVGLCGLGWWLTRIGATIRMVGPRKDRWGAAMVVALVPPALLDHYLFSSWAGLALLSLVLAAAVRRSQEES